MLTLYTKATCPFCTRVLAVLDRLQLDIDLKDISENDAYVDELVSKGGKRQVPYLVDDEQAVAMYESDDIIAHLQAHYGTATAPASKPRVHISDSACVSCEG